MAQVRLLTAAAALCASAAAAEPIESIVVGAYYYRTGLVHDPQVQVIEVDVAGNRVKVLDIETSNIDWIEPERLLNRSDSTDRDLERLVFGLQVLDALLAPEAPAPAPARVWQPGSAHPDHANVVALATEGDWAPAPGYAWVDAATGWAVRWQPGAPHPDHPHVRSAPEESMWAPVEGYAWVDRGRTWAVSWRPGSLRADGAEVASEVEGLWVDSRDWEVVDRGEGADPRWVRSLRSPNEAPAPTSTRRLFDRDDYDLYVRGDEFYAFHAPEIDYTEFSHALFHPEERWIALVTPEGELVDLGDRIHRLMMPEILGQDQFGLVRTRDGEVVEGMAYVLRVAEGEWDSRSPPLRFYIGLRMAAGAEGDGEGEAPGGVLVESVIEGSPAEAAGLRAGDVVVQVDDRPVRVAEDLIRYIDGAEDDNILLRYLRDGEPDSVVLAAVPVDAAE